MTQDPLGGVHLGLSAEAMLLIAPQLEYCFFPSQQPGPGWLVSVILCLGLLTLLCGTVMAPHQRLLFIV